MTPCGWGVKAGMVCVWVAGEITGHYLSALEMHHDKALHKFMFTLLFTLQYS